MGQRHDLRDKFLERSSEHQIMRHCQSLQDNFDYARAMAQLVGFEGNLLSDETLVDLEKFGETLFRAVFEKLSEKTVDFDLGDFRFFESRDDFRVELVNSVKLAILLQQLQLLFAQFY